MEWIRNDELFIKELTTGSKWAKYVADFLTSNGIQAEAPEMEIRKDINDIERFSVGDKDILFARMPGHLEVKSRNLKFGEDSTSYPYDTAFVDTLDGWNKKQEKPLAVILVSQKTGNMMVAPVSTESAWGSVSKYDTVRGIYETWLTIDKNLLRPVSELVEWLLKRQA